MYCKCFLTVKEEEGGGGEVRPRRTNTTHCDLHVGANADLKRGEQKVVTRASEDVGERGVLIGTEVQCERRITSSVL